MERISLGHIFAGAMRKRLATPKNVATFDLWFSRSRPLLHVVAQRVLGDREAAELAIENCWLSTSRNPPRFDHEGAFRSWLLRRVIDEALDLLRQRVENARNDGFSQALASQESRWQSNDR